MSLTNDPYSLINLDHGSRSAAVRAHPTDLTGLFDGNFNNGQVQGLCGPNRWLETKMEVHRKIGMHRIMLAAGLILAALVLANCGGGSGPSEMTMQQTPVPEAAPEATPQQPGDTQTRQTPCCVAPFSVETTGTVTRIDDAWHEYTDWGVWARDSNGNVIVQVHRGASGRPVRLGIDPETGIKVVTLDVFVGTRSGNNPTGSATWSGRAVGWLEQWETNGDDLGVKSITPMTGRSQFTFDLADGTIDAAFNNWSSPSAPDLSFEDVAVTNGNFGTGFEVANPEANFPIHQTMSGGFFGPSHEGAAARFSRTFMGPFSSQRHFYGMAAAGRD